MHVSAAVGFGLLVAAGAGGVRGESTYWEDVRPGVKGDPRREGKAAAVEEETGYRPIPRIVGGTESTAGKFPWMAALVTPGRNDYDGQFCGASLVHPWWVLTAAHCVVGERPGTLEVLVGKTDLKASGGVRLAVSEILVHPDYHPVTQDCDLALLRLAAPAPEELAVIPLIDEVALGAPGVMATAAGWGDTKVVNNRYPAKLREVSVPIVSLETANATSAYSGSLTANMLPAGYAAGGKDSCQGDSGGPLMVPSPVGPGWMQAGVVSFGEGCAEPNAYGIYTRLTNFRSYLMGRLYPAYGFHEEATGQWGEWRDRDGNGRTAMEDFALEGSRLELRRTGDLRWQRPLEAAEVAYRIETAADLMSAWTEWSGLAVQSELSGGGRATDSVNVGALTEGRRFFRLRAETSRELAKGYRPVKTGDGESGFMGAPDLDTGLGRRSRLYRLEGLEAGVETRIAVRSSEFAPAFELRSVPELSGAVAEAGSVAPAMAAASGLTGADQVGAFVPEAGKVYYARVLSQGAADGGAFEFNVWREADRTTEATLTAATTLSGQVLDGTDALDPASLPGQSIRKDDFLLVLPAPAANGYVQVQMSSSQVDSRLTVYDGESGRFLTESDDAVRSSLNSVVRWLPVPGKPYVLRCGTAVANQQGGYTLAVTTPVAAAVSGTVQPGVMYLLPASGTTSSMSLTNASELDPSTGSYKQDFLLPEVTSSRWQVDMRSNAVDAYLQVLDAHDLTVVTAADGGGGGSGVDNARVIFTRVPGRRYVLRATTYYEGETGSYTLVLSHS